MIESSFAQDVQPAAVLHDVFVNEFTDVLVLTSSQLRQLIEGKLDVEVARVADHGAVFHGHEVLAPDHVNIAGDRDKDVAQRSGFGDRLDLETIHGRLESSDGINLGDDDMRTHAPARSDTPLPHQP